MKTPTTVSPFAGAGIAGPELHGPPGRGGSDFAVAMSNMVGLARPNRPAIVSVSSMSLDERQYSGSIASAAHTLLGRVQEGHPASAMVEHSEQIFAAVKGGAKLSPEDAFRLKGGLESVLQVMHTSPSYAQGTIIPEDQSRVEGNVRLALDRLELAARSPVS